MVTVVSRPSWRDRRPEIAERTHHRAIAVRNPAQRADGGKMVPYRRVAAEVWTQQAVVNMLSSTGWFQFRSVQYLRAEILEGEIFSTRPAACDRLAPRVDPVSKSHIIPGFSIIDLGKFRNHWGPSSCGESHRKMFGGSGLRDS
jgi:hypothetical protein